VITLPHLQRLRPLAQVISSSAAALPFLLGPLMLNFPDDSHSLWIISRGFIAFILLFLSWRLLVTLGLRYLRWESANEQKASARILGISSLVLLLVSVLLLLITLGLFRHTTPGYEFYLGLGVLPLNLAMRYLRAEEKFQFLTLFALLYYTLVGTVSFSLVSFEIFLEAVALSLAVAALCSLPWAVCAYRSSYEHLASLDDSSKAYRRFKSILRTVSFVTLLPLIILGFLLFTYSLSPIYYTLLISTWPAYHLLKGLDRSAKATISQEHAEAFKQVELNASHYIAAFIAFLILSRAIEWIYAAVVVTRQY